MRNWIVITVLAVSAPAYAERSVEQIKQELVNLAYSYQGQGDPDYAIQSELQVLVDELLAANPQPAIEERLNLLHGTWYQVWGAYEYRRNDRETN